MFVALPYIPCAAVDWNETECISVDAFLPESNKGFQLLLKMGWSAGTGDREQAMPQLQYSLSFLQGSGEHAAVASTPFP
jgi:hypothetical protein